MVEQEVFKNAYVPKNLNKVHYTIHLKLFKQIVFLLSIFQ